MAAIAINLGYIFSLVNGGLTGWTAWSTCSKTCNTNTVSIRERYCTNPPPQGKGKDCAGQRMQARACASSKCPGKLIKTQQTLQRPKMLPLTDK